MKPDRIALFQHALHHHQHHAHQCSPASPVAAGSCVSAAPPAYTAAVARRNERERNRVRLVNHGFNALRQHVPQTGQKKLSKVETLRSAVEYIRELQELLELTRRRSQQTQQENRAPPALLREVATTPGYSSASPLTTESASSPGSSDGGSSVSHAVHAGVLREDCVSPKKELQQCAAVDDDEQEVLWELASWWPAA